MNGETVKNAINNVAGKAASPYFKNAKDAGIIVGLLLASWQLVGIGKTLVTREDVSEMIVKESPYNEDRKLLTSAISNNTNALKALTDKISDIELVHEVSMSRRAKKRYNRLNGK